MYMWFHIMVEHFRLFRDIMMITVVACLYETISSQITVLTEQISVYWCQEKLIIGKWLRSQQAVRGFDSPETIKVCRTVFKNWQAELCQCANNTSTVPELSCWPSASAVNISEVPVSSYLTVWFTNFFCPLSHLPHYFCHHSNLKLFVSLLWTC